MSERPDRVLVWRSQLVANDFPPVCAMTGATAQTWRKFRFVTAPAWAYALLVLICTGIGLLPIFIVMRIVSRTASGHLPLTNASAQKLRTVTSIAVALFLLMLVFWAVGIFVPSVAGSDNPTANTIAGLAFFLGLLSGLAGVTVWLLVKPRFGPGGRVMATQPGHNDNIVQLSRLHPAFVAAVQQHQQARAAQHQAAPPSIPPPPPEPPPPQGKFSS